MSNKSKIYGKGRIEGPWTGVRYEVLDSAAWKRTSMGARLLYIALLRRLSFKAYNNGNIYLATRKAAEELGASQRIVCIWFRELEHYGFVEMTEQGSIGPRGRATRWRITDMEWGELDGKPIKATKDYLKRGREPFGRRNPDACLTKNKRLNSEQKYSGRRPKVLTTDDQKYSAHPPSDDQKCSEGSPPDDEQKYSDLDIPSPVGDAGLAPSSEESAATVQPPDDWRRNSKTETERLHSPDDDLNIIPEFLRRTVK